MSTRELRIEQILGREVRDRHGARVGRLEEFRTEQRGRETLIVEYLIGAAGLLERLGLGVRLIVGAKVEGYVASWNQIDISDPERPRLTCSIADLRRF